MSGTRRASTISAGSMPFSLKCVRLFSRKPPMARRAVYTIAAPSPGNAEFAVYYNTLFTDPSGHSTAFRFFNNLDVVPNAWATLATVMTYYPPMVPSPSDIDKIVVRGETALPAVGKLKH